MVEHLPNMHMVLRLERKQQGKLETDVLCLDRAEEIVQWVNIPASKPKHLRPGPALGEEN